MWHHQRFDFCPQVMIIDSWNACVVLTCAKNNDGALGPRTAWERRDGVLFAPVRDFDWEAFDSGGTRRELFQNGRRWLHKSMAAKELEELTGAKRSAAYEALKEGGRFADFLLFDPKNGMVSLKPEPPEEDSGDDGEEAL